MPSEASDRGLRRRVVAAMADLWTTSFVRVFNCVEVRSRVRTLWAVVAGAHVHPCHASEPPPQPPRSGCTRSGSAWCRSERRFRWYLRHERMAIAMAAEKLHHWYVRQDGCGGGAQRRTEYKKVSAGDGGSRAFTVRYQNQDVSKSHSVLLFVCLLEIIRVPFLSWRKLAGGFANLIRALPSVSFDLSAAVHGSLGRLAAAGLGHCGAYQWIVLRWSTLVVKPLSFYVSHC